MTHGGKVEAPAATGGFSLSGDLQYGTIYGIISLRLTTS